jgi:hypothetical protein
MINQPYSCGNTECLFRTKQDSFFSRTIIQDLVQMTYFFLSQKRFHPFLIAVPNTTIGNLMLSNAKVGIFWPRVFLSENWIISCYAIVISMILGAKNNDCCGCEMLVIYIQREREIWVCVKKIIGDEWH